MSTDDQPGLLESAYRTVTPSYRPREEGSMDAVGWAILLGLVVLLVPLLPFAILVWLISRGLEAFAGESDEGPG
jgi:hypothetical protein